MANPNPFEDHGIKPLDDEQVIVSRNTYPHEDGEITAISNRRFIFLGAAYPGPSFFGCTTPIDSCRSIEYKTINHSKSLLSAWLTLLTGIACTIICILRDWFLALPFAVAVALFALPFLFQRLTSTEIQFHCENSTLKWRLPSAKHAGNAETFAKILSFAKDKGIQISNFPASK